MQHGGSDRHFIATSVAKTGRSLNLGKGQFAIVEKSKPATKDGLKIVSDFKGLPKSTKVQMLLGSAGLGPSRSVTNKSWKTLDFQIDEIVGLKVSAPKEGIKVDEQVLGYNGFDDETAISLEAGDNEEFQIALSGDSIGMLGYEDAVTIVTDYFTAPKGAKATSQAEADAGAWTDEQVVEEAILRMKNKVLMGGVKLTDYVDITPVNSNSGAATGTDQVFYNLTLKDDGTHTDLGLVKAQYPDLSIVRSDSSDSGSTYTAIAGALPAAYSYNEAWLVKGCDDCPAGYTQFSDGFVYSIAIEDDGADSTAAIELISVNTTAGSAVAVNVDGGLTTYTVVVSAELTQAETDAFITANEEAVIELVSRDVTELCSPDNIVTQAWVQGDTCKVETEGYSIIVPHDECDNAPTAAIQAAYPDLTIAVDSAANCATKYTTTVTTNVVCEECSTQFRDLFISEAPDSFGIHPWKKDASSYAFDSKMGVRFKAKPFIFAGNEEYRDNIPDLATSTKIQVSGGYSGTVSSSFSEGSTAGRYAVTVLSVASDPENWGMNLRDWESAASMHFAGENRYKGNNYANFVLGNETNLKATSPYVDYTLIVRKNTVTQGLYGRLEELMEYHVVVEPGLHKDVEDVLNALAAEAGVKTVQAFGNTSA